MAFNASKDAACGTGIKKVAREYFTSPSTLSLSLPYPAAEPVLKQGMADASGEGSGAQAFAVAENPRHRDFEIVVQNRNRHAAEERKCRDVAVEKGFRRLGRIGLDETGVRMRQVATEESQQKTCSFIRTPPMTPTHSPKSTCGRASGWASGTTTSRDRLCASCT